MTSKYAEEEEKIQCALEDAQSRELGQVNIAAIAKDHGVNEQRLRRRFNGGASKMTRFPTNRKLTQGQEDAILAWIGILDSLELSARPALLEASANKLLRDAHTDTNTPPPVVGKNWTRNFMQRHDDLQLVKQKAQELLRMGHDREVCAAFFVRLKKIIDEYGILPSDIWNMDEIGFRIGIGGQQWIITLSTSREARIGSSTNRESVTCIEAISATGSHTAPMVIVSACQHSEAWTKNDLSDDTLIAVNSSGYSDDILALRWIKHFAKATEKMTVGKKRLLIFDGHGSHCTREFIEVCISNDIIPFTLPPHSSHFMQPLDVSVFQPYKHWHKEAVDQATRTGCSNFDKTEFLAALNSIRRNTFKKNTIKSGFRCTGIHPFDPDQVLNRFKEEQTVASSPSPASSPAPQVPTTPRSVRSLKRSAAWLEERTEQLSPTLHRHTQALIRGALLQAQTGSLAIKALEEQTAAQQERDKRKERQRKVTQSGGVLSLGQARSICEDKMAAEETQERKREWATFKKEAKKRRKEGMGKLHAELRRQVKKRANRLAKLSATDLPDFEEDPEDEEEDEDDEDDAEPEDVLWDDVFGSRYE